NTLIAVNPPGNTLTAAEHFVQALYTDELGRSGSPAELDLWAGLLTAAPNSAEYQQQQGFIAQGIGTSLEARDHLVRGWYVAFLGRQAQGGEEVGWVGLLQQGRAEEHVLSGLLASGEFFARAQ